MNTPVPTLGEYCEYLESLEQPFDLDALLADDLVLEPVGAANVVVDLDSERPGRTGRRGWLIAVAAVLAAALLVAGTVVATGDRSVRSDGPAGRTPTPTPTPPPTRSVSDRVLSLDAVFPLPGATPSTPRTGELVAAVSPYDNFPSIPGADRWNGVALELYADGRVLRFPTADAHGGIAEQRLTPEGVELVRSAFAPTGLFDSAQTPTDLFWACACFLNVRDDSGRLVQNAMPPPQPQQVDPLAEQAKVDPRVQGEVDRLIEFMTHLDASLPAGAWADREVRAYVPSRYRVSVSRAGFANDRAVADVSKALARVVPDRLVRRLDDEGWQHRAWDDSVVLTTADARALAQALIDSGHTPTWPGWVTWGIGLTYSVADRVLDPHPMIIRLDPLRPLDPA